MTDPEGGAAVTAQALSLRGPRGWVYREVDLDAAPGSLVAVEGPAGSGRSSLLLTLAGRMRPTGGTATVAGLHLPQQAAKVRRIAALGQMPGVNQLDPALTVGEHLRERQLLHAPLLSLLGRRSRDPNVAQALATAGLTPQELPRGPRTPVRDLDALQLLQLATGLALIGRPRLLCVDDTDDRLHADDRAAAWRLLHTVAATGVTVLAATTDATAALDLTDLVVRLPGHPEDAAPTAAAPRRPGGPPAPPAPEQPPAPRQPAEDREDTAGPRQPGDSTAGPTDDTEDTEDTEDTDARI